MIKHPYKHNLLEKGHVLAYGSGGTQSIMTGKTLQQTEKERGSGGRLSGHTEFTRSK